MKIAPGPLASFTAAVVAAAAPAGASPTSAAPARPIAVQLKTPFVLAVGQSARLDAEDLTITVEKIAQTPLRGGGGSGVEQAPFSVASLRLERKQQTQRGDIGVGTWLVIDDLVVRFDSDGEVGKSVRLVVALSRKP